ncbi:MAG: P-loop NTPase [Promethearchaeota archaeon]
MPNNKDLFNVAIISGKGGVGKTSITSSLAYNLATSGHPMVLVDGDVDAPNLGILFQPPNNSKNPDQKSEDIKEYQIKTTEKARLQEDLCMHCRKCIDEEFCSFNALSWDEDKALPVIDTIACEGCRACNLLCPTHAFEIYSVDSGTIREYETEEGIHLISGETILGSQTSGKLVTELRKIAENRAKTYNIPMLLLDAGPGIGCPVLAAVSGMDYIILVTEPTSAALHDVERAITVIESFKIPFGIIINKKDMNLSMYHHMIDHFGSKNYEILGEIPLNEQWPYAIVQRQPISKYLKDSEILSIFTSISEKIVNKATRSNPKT